YPRAQKKLMEALKWNEKKALDTVSEAETDAEILLELTRVAFNAESPKKGAESVARRIPKVQELAAKWKDSWRLEYVLVRLENVRTLDGSPRAEFHNLAERL